MFARTVDMYRSVKCGSGTLNSLSLDRLRNYQCLIGRTFGGKLRCSMCTRASLSIESQTAVTVARADSDKPCEQPAAVYPAARSTCPLPRQRQAAPSQCRGVPFTATTARRSQQRNINQPWRQRLRLAASLAIRTARGQRPPAQHGHSRCR